MENTYTPSVDRLGSLTIAARLSFDVLTSADSYGGAVAYDVKPCVTVYGIPAWIMPNGMIRLGDPNAPMIDADHAARTIRQINSDRRRLPAPDDAREPEGYCAHGVPEGQRCGQPDCAGAERTGYDSRVTR